MTSLTVEDAESSFLKGMAEFELWFQEFSEKWNKPNMVDVLGVMVNTMPMESRILNPVVTAAAEMAYKKMRGG